MVLPRCAIVRHAGKTVSTRIKYFRPSGHNEVIITRLRLGKLHQITKHQDGSCHHCNKQESVAHFIAECTNDATCSAVFEACKN